ncbi:MAG: hypothetical protein VX694_07365 [Planctomycetota bacterium]|nr:hypothetical protein [Planctomycetota bacterium]
MEKNSGFGEGFGPPASIRDKPRRLDHDIASIRSHYSTVRNPPFVRISTINRYRRGFKIRGKWSTSVADNREICIRLNAN